MNTVLYHHNDNSYLPSGELSSDIQECLTNINFQFHKGCGSDLRDNILNELSNMNQNIIQKLLENLIFIWMGCLFCDAADETSTDSVVPGHFSADCL